MPAGPLDGKASWKLPVLAQPQSDADRRPGRDACWAGASCPASRSASCMCTSDAGVQGVAACDLGVDGRLRARDVRVTPTATARSVRRHGRAPDRHHAVHRPGRLHCPAPSGASSPSAPSSDYDRSGGHDDRVRRRSRRSPCRCSPSIRRRPTTPDQVVAVRASSMMPGREAQIRECLDDRCARAVPGRRGRRRHVRRRRRRLPGVPGRRRARRRAARATCVLRVGGIGLEGASAAPEPADVPLRVRDAGHDAGRRPT